MRSTSAASPSDEVGVHVQRRRRIAVSQTTGHGADVHASTQQLRDDKVPEVVESNIGHALLLAVPLERTRDRVGKPRHARIGSMAEDETRSIQRSWHQIGNESRKLGEPPRRVALTWTHLIALAARTGFEPVPPP